MTLCPKASNKTLATQGISLSLSPVVSRSHLQNIYFIFASLARLMGRLITTAYANCRKAVVAYPVNFPHVGQNQSTRRKLTIFDPIGKKLNQD